MLVALVLAAQLTTAQTPEELMARQRVLLARGFDEVIAELDAMEQRALGTQKARTPVLGMVMELKELGGTPPWRAIMITGVITGSAADLAGIKSGDRLSAIGTRWLDRHTCVAVALYLSDFPRSVPLVIERDGKLRAVTLKRKAEPCITEAYRIPTLERWHVRIINLRTTARKYRSQIPSLVTQERLRIAGENLYATIQLAIMMMALNERDIELATLITCGATLP
jgi:C-terminal processing protease CtpA/Prc